MLASIAIVATTASSALLALPIVCALAATTAAAATLPGVQRRLDDQRRDRERRERREARETRLEEAGVRGARLAMLTQLADRIAEHDPRATHDLDLEHLLDRYVAVAIALARCGHVAATAEALRGHSRCREPSAALHEELAVIEELLVFHAERCALEACAALGPGSAVTEL